MDMENWKTHGKIYLENVRTHQKMPLDYSVYEDLMAHEHEYNLELAIQKVNKPVLIIHGKQDESVPFEHAEKLYNSCSHSVLIPVESAGHTFGCAHPMKDLSEAPEYFWTVLDNTLEFIQDDIELY